MERHGKTAGGSTRRWGRRLAGAWAAILITLLTTGVGVAQPEAGSKGDAGSVEAPGPDGSSSAVSEPTGRIEGRVVDEAGRPVGESTVYATIEPSSAPGRGAGTRGFMTKSDGRFALDGVPPRGARGVPGEWWSAGPGLWRPGGASRRSLRRPRPSRPPPASRPFLFGARLGDRFRDGIDEGLVLLGVGAGGDGEGLEMRLLREPGRADIRHPDLDRSQPLLPQPASMVSDSFARGLAHRPASVPWNVAGRSG